MICARFAVVRVPFPFSERPGSKPRPALVLSAATFNATGHTVMAMITRAAHTRWPSDYPIRDLDEAGLPAASYVRLKIFTLENTLLIRRSGSLSAADSEGFAAVLRPVLA